MFVRGSILPFGLAHLPCLRAQHLVGESFASILLCDHIRAQAVPLESPCGRRPDRCHMRSTKRSRVEPGLAKRLPCAFDAIRTGKRDPRVASAAELTQRSLEGSWIRGRSDDDRRHNKRLGARIAE